MYEDVFNSIGIMGLVKVIGYKLACYMLRVFINTSG